MSGPVVVTGSDSGIGRATALALAASGFPVGVTWHTPRGRATAASAARSAGSTWPTTRAPRYGRSRTISAGSGAS